jgi:hypothetical protein
MSRPKRAISSEVLEVYETLHNEGKLPVGSAGYGRWQELILIASRDRLLKHCAGSK